MAGDEWMQDESGPHDTYGDWVMIPLALVAVIVLLVLEIFYGVDPTAGLQYFK